MSESNGLGRHLTKQKRCALTYPRQMYDVSLKVHVFSELETCSEGDFQMTQTRAETHVVFADAF